MDELIDNLLFSATLEGVAFPRAGRKPTAAERIVHNGARRRLAERYGSEEYLALAEREQTRCFVRSTPWILPAVMTGAWIWSVLLARGFFAKPKH